MSYPYPAPYPPPYQQPYPPLLRPPSTSTTGPKVLTFIGIGLLVLSIGIGVVGGLMIASGTNALDGSIQEAYSKVDQASIATIQPGQTETVRLTSHTVYTMWLDSDDSTGSRPVVTDPTGATVNVSTNTYSESSWDADESIEGWRFTSRDAGLYKISAAADGPTLYLMAGLELDKLLDGLPGVARAVGGGFLVTTAFGLGLTGLGMGIGGAFWWAARSRNASRAAQTGGPVG